MSNKAILLFLLVGLIAGYVLADKNEPITVTGVRGLSEMQEDVDTTLRDYAAIEALDQIRVKADEVRSFVSEGGLK